jgi:hypothetical protein
MELQEQNDKEYTNLPSGKIKCKICDSELNFAGFTAHKKTKKHLSGKEGKYIVKSAPINEYMRQSVNNMRQAKVNELGIEQVRLNEKLKKRAQRLRIKQGETPKTRGDGPTENKHDTQLLTLNKAREKVKTIKDKKGRLEITDIVNKGRQAVATDKESMKVSAKNVVKEISGVQERKDNSSKCDDLIDDIGLDSLHNTEKKLERQTIKGYITKIKYIHDTLYVDDWDCQDFEWLHKTESVIDFVTGMSVGDGTKHNYFVAIYSILYRLDEHKDLAKEYFDIKNTYRDMIATEKGKNIMTPKEEANILPWKQLKNFVDSGWTPKQKLIDSLYTLIPPRRLKDYSYMKLIRNKSLPFVQALESEYNYLLVNKKNKPLALVINNYKTKKIYGQFTIDLLLSDQKPVFNFSELRSNIKTYIRTLNSGQLLFPNNKKEVDRKFGDVIKDVYKKTNKSMSINLIRHSFVSDFLSNKVSDNTIRKMAAYLGHSYTTFLSYRKIDMIEDEDSDS